MGIFLTEAHRVTLPVLGNSVALPVLRCMVRSCTVPYKVRHPQGGLVSFPGNEWGVRGCFLEKKNTPFGALSTTFFESPSSSLFFFDSQDKLFWISGPWESEIFLP